MQYDIFTLCSVLQPALQIHACLFFPHGQEPSNLCMLGQMPTSLHAKRELDGH